MYIACPGVAIGDLRQGRIRHYILGGGEPELKAPPARKTNLNECLSRVVQGWLSGIEPELKAPQASVLPLHHSHPSTSLAKKSTYICWHAELARVPQ